MQVAGNYHAEVIYLGVSNWDEYEMESILGRRDFETKPISNLSFLRISFALPKGLSSRHSASSIHTDPSNSNFCKQKTVLLSFGMQ